MNSHHLTIALLSLSAILPSSSLAQSTPPPGTNLPPNTPNKVDSLPKPTETPAPQKTPAPSPSPLPITPPPQYPDTPSPSISKAFPIKTIEILGNTVLQTEIQTAKTNFLKKHPKTATFEDIIALRSEITKLYLDNQYVTSGAFILNNQPLDSGKIEIQIVEGGLEAIEIEGLKNLNKSYIISRLRQPTQAPLNKTRLETALQLLQIDPLLEQVNAELTAGKSPGLNILKLTLKEAQPFHAGITFANSQSPSVGSLQTTFYTSHDSVFGFGDRFNAEYGRTDGLTLYSAGYSIPISPQNGTLSLRYSKNKSKIIEEPFNDLGIRSQSDTLSISLRQPLNRTPTSEFAIGLGLDLRSSQTFILDDIPFSFSEGPQEGKSKVTVIRFFQDWVNRSPKRVLAARSQFNFGINAFNATLNDSGPDGTFFSWIGQAQWVQQITPGMVMVARLDGQLTPNSLLSLERFSLGGQDTVRGYRQNELVADNGIIGAIELRIPLNKARTLQVSPFIEFGTGWNNQGENPDPRWISGTGLGLQWQASRSLSLRLDYGLPLVRIDNSGGSLQDKGLFFTLRYQPL